MTYKERNPSLWIKGANEPLPAATTTASVTSALSQQGGKIDSRTSDLKEGSPWGKGINTSEKLIPSITFL